MRDGARRSPAGGPPPAFTGTSEPCCAKAGRPPPSAKPAPRLAVRNSLLFMEFFIRFDILEPACQLTCQIITHFGSWFPPRSAAKRVAPLLAQLHPFVRRISEPVRWPDQMRH